LTPALRCGICLWSLIHLGSAAMGESADVRLRVLPETIELSGSGAIQHVLLERFAQGEAVGDATDLAQWSTSDVSVARVEGGIVLPVGNGTATLSAVTPEGSATASIEVVAMDTQVPWEFRRHVLPVISRAGCNMGACHGALAGKGGFRLSLRGYHPEGDFFTITREARGRRIELADPGTSLLLAKPSGALPHKGGLRLDPQSREYQVVSQWIAAGAPAPSSQDAILERLEVAPAQSRLAPGDRQRLLVTAFYTDGRREDVTAWAKFSSSDQTVAQVDEHGVVTVDGHGEGAIVVWFSSQIVLARVVSPFAQEVAELDWSEFVPANFIDERALDKWKQLNLQPSIRCTDVEFVRRVYLDTIGRLPAPEDVRSFVRDTRPDKRVRLIDQLLARDEYVDFWTHKFSDLLLINGRRLRPDAVKAYYRWIRGHVARNTRWDDLVREIVTASGSSVTNGATNFFALHQDPESMSENVCQAFLGLSIGCAKCHNHPLEKWTNDEYYAMANFFSRVKAKGWGGDARSGDGVRTLFVDNQGELTQPLTGRPQPPTPLDGEPLPLDAPGDRRKYLADWLVAPENPYFARAIANRIWANFLGKGLVEPVDDLRASNPARNEPLLRALSEFLVDADFELKSLIRQILISETYQRSSQPLPSNLADQHYFSRYYPKRLSAEVLLDAISQVTGVPSQFTQIGYDGNDFQATDQYPVGTRALELHDSAVVSEFLETFGRNDRDITCECERSNTPSIVQVLHISNGTTINERLKDEQSCVASALAGPLNWERIIDEAYVRTLSRRPTPEEMEKLTAECSVAQDADARQLVEDLYWSLMSSREFLFNH
jgi:hypothetical protein